MCLDCYYDVAPPLLQALSSYPSLEELWVGRSLWGWWQSEYDGRADASRLSLLIQVAQNPTLRVIYIVADQRHILQRFEWRRAELLANHGQDSQRSRTIKRFLAIVKLIC